MSDTEVNVLGTSLTSAAGQKRGFEEIDAAEEEESNGKVVLYSSLTVKQLNELINEREIEKKGARRRKADLIGLLEANDENPAVAAEDTNASVAAPSSSNPAAPQAKKLKQEPEAQTPKPKSKKRKTKPKPSPYKEPEEFDPVDYNSRSTKEKRSRPYQPFPKKEMHTKIWKAKNEKMFMLSRTKGMDAHGRPQETFQVAGSTGNVYKVVFNQKPSCDCLSNDYGGKNTHCKHVVYIKINVLKITGILSYQVAYLSSEVQEIFINAPVTELPKMPGDAIEDEANHNGKRKSLDNDCPICMTAFEDGEDIVWCKAACGQNIHAECFGQWKQKGTGGATTKCPYCRTPWQKDVDPLDALIASAPRDGMGYRNLGQHLGYDSHSQAQHKVEGDDDYDEKW